MGRQIDAATEQKGSEVTTGLALTDEAAKVTELWQETKQQNKWTTQDEAKHRAETKQQNGDADETNTVKTRIISGPSSTEVDQFQQYLHSTNALHHRHPRHHIDQT